MNRKNQAHRALIDRMLEARSEQEVEAVEKDAEGWLQEKPGDVRFIAASERPVKTGARSGARGQSAVAIRIRSGVHAGGTGGRSGDG